MEKCATTNAEAVICTEGKLNNETVLFFQHRIEKRRSRIKISLKTFS